MKVKKILAVVMILCMAFGFCGVLAVPENVQAAEKISTTKKTLTVGQSFTLKITGTSKNAKWSSSNKSVATVTSKGKVTAKKAGTATITATVGTKKLTCKVTVKNYTLTGYYVCKELSLEEGDNWDKMLHDLFIGKPNEVGYTSLIFGSMDSPVTRGEAIFKGKDFLNKDTQFSWYGQIYGSIKVTLNDDKSLNVVITVDEGKAISAGEHTYKYVKVRDLDY